MTVTTRSPTTVVSSGAWVNVANVFASDTARATLSTTGTSTFTVSGFGLAPLIGTDTVNSITIRVQHFENQTNQNRFYVDLLDNGTLLAGGQQIATRTAEGYNSVVLTGITAAQINNLQLRVEGTKQGGGGSRTFNVNHVEISVDHTPALPPAPVAPSDLAAEAVSASQINLTWTLPANATSADVELDTFVVVGATSPYPHSGLAESSNHSYRVRAVGPGGTSAWSNVVSATTLGLAITTPPAGPVDGGTPTSTYSEAYDGGTPTSTFELTIDGGVETPSTGPIVRLNGVNRTILKYRMNGVDRTVASFRLNGVNR